MPGYLHIWHSHTAVRHNTRFFDMTGYYKAKGNKCSLIVTGIAVGRFEALLQQHMSYYTFLYMYHLCTR